VTLIVNKSHVIKKKQIIFKYRLSRWRRVVENAFGHLSNRFRIFLTTIIYVLKKSKKLL